MINKLSSLDGLLLVKVYQIHQENLLFFSSYAILSVQRQSNDSKYQNFILYLHKSFQRFCTLFDIWDKETLLSSMKTQRVQRSCSPFSSRCFEFTQKKKNEKTIIVLWLFRCFVSIFLFSFNQHNFKTSANALNFRYFYLASS